MQYDRAFWDWIASHRDDDPARLRLGRKADAPAWFDDAVTQIENERRSRAKFALPGYEHLIPRLMPVTVSVEQASSTRVALLHSTLSRQDGKAPDSVLDMTCGLGLDASFIAAGESVHLTAIELDPRIAAVAAYNFRDRPNIEVINGDSIEYLENTDRHFDLIFIDPARRGTDGGRVYNLHDCQPDVTALMPLMLKKARRVMVKMSPMLDVTQTLRDLPGTRQLWVVGERGECRELLAIVEPGECTEPTVNVWSDGITFSFTQVMEADAEAVTAMPATGRYLLEPSAALMKAAPFKLLCRRFDAAMLHPNTHLYVTAQCPDCFPGKTWRITEVLPYSSGNIKRIARQHLDADIAVRNFPIRAEALRARLGIKKSGDTRIMGVTAIDGRQYLLFLLEEPGHIAPIVPLLD